MIHVTDGRLNALQEIKVKNKDQMLVFTGERLAFDSSWANDKGRWHETAVYRTQAQQYVVARVGRSDVVHMSTCERAAKGDDLERVTVTDGNIDVFMPCGKCHPTLAVGAALLLEPDKFWAQVCPTPTGLLKTFVRTDDDGVRYLPDIAHNLIKTVTACDSRVKEAYDSLLAVQIVQ